MSTTSEKIYGCQICGKTFSRRTYLQLHEKIHGEKCYKCNTCDKAFRQPAGLWIHKKHQSCVKQNLHHKCVTSSGNGQTRETTNDSEKRHKCDVCDRGFSQKHLLTYHKRTHTGENPYPCLVCNKMFRSLTNLKYHERTHTGQKPYKCIFCVKTFTQLGPLKQHCRKQHQSEKVYECVVCKEKFEKFRELSSHKKIHLEISLQSPGDRVICTTEECEGVSNKIRKDGCQSLVEAPDPDKKTRLETSIGDCSASTRAEEGKSEKFINEEHSTSASVICAFKNECDVALGRVNRHDVQSSDKSMDSHNETCLVAIHANEENTSASTIGVSTEEDQTSTRHFKQENEHENASIGGMKYRCNVCNQEFSCALVLKYHKRTHTGENPHPCIICNKKFRTPGALTVHQRTHNGQKPYKCIFCSKAFTQRGPLLQHCKRIHNSDQIYECEVCKERFERYSYLSCHKQVHSDVSCTMAKRMYDEVNFAVKLEDEVKPVQEMESACSSAVVDSPISSSDVCDCDSDKENNSQVLAECEPPCNLRHKDHETSSTNSSYQETVINFSDKCLSVIPRIKQEIKEDGDCSNDSGIFQDTSPFDVNAEFPKRESDLLHVVSTYMQPIKMEVEECDYSSCIWSRPSQTAGDMKRLLPESQVFPSHANIGGSKTHFIEMNAGDEEEVSNCSRVTTPENDHMFSSCHDDFLQNSFLGKNSDARSNCQFIARNHDIHLNQVPTEVKLQHRKEDEQPNASYYGVNTEIDLLQDCANNAPIHSDVTGYCIRKLLYSQPDGNMTRDRNIFESQIGTPREFFRNQEHFVKINTLENAATRSSNINDDHNMSPVLSQSNLCVCLKDTTGITRDCLHQNTNYVSEGTSASGEQNICFKCDVLPASWHLV